MGFLDDLADAVTNPLDHPFEAAMIMAMMEEEEEEDEELDLFDDDDDFELEDDFKLEDDEAEETYSWRENTEDGEFYGLDPEDFESEEEYESELILAEVTKDKLEEAAEQFGVDVDLCVDMEELKQEVYPRMDLWQLLGARYGVPYYVLNSDTFEEIVARFCSIVGEQLPEVVSFMELPLEGDVSEDEFFDACSSLWPLHIDKILGKMDKRVLLDDYTRKLARNMDVHLNQFQYYNEFLNELHIEVIRQKKIGDNYGIDRNDYKSKKSFLRDIELVKELLGPLPHVPWNGDSKVFFEKQEEVKAERRKWLKEYKATQKKNSKDPVEKKPPEAPTETAIRNVVATKQESDGNGPIPPKPSRLQGVVSDEVWEETVRKMEKEKRDKFFERVGIFGAILIPIILNAATTPFLIIILAEIIWIGIMIGAKMKDENRANEDQEKSQDEAPEKK